MGSVAGSPRPSHDRDHDPGPGPGAGSVPAPRGLARADQPGVAPVSETRYCSDYPEHPRHCCGSCHDDLDRGWGDLLEDFPDHTYYVCCGVYNEFIKPEEAT